MTTQELINERLGGFLEYLKLVLGTEANRFRTDQLVTILLFQEYLRYSHMLKQWHKAQEKKRAQEEANRDWEDAEFVTIWDGGKEIKTKARFDRNTGFIEVLEKADGQELEVLDDQYLLNAKGERLEVYETGGEFYARINKEETDADDPNIERVNEKLNQDEPAA